MSAVAAATIERQASDTTISRKSVAMGMSVGTRRWQGTWGKWDRGFTWPAVGAYKIISYPSSEKPRWRKQNQFYLPLCFYIGAIKKRQRGIKVHIMLEKLLALLSNWLPPGLQTSCSNYWTTRAARFLLTNKLKDSAENKSRTEAYSLNQNHFEYQNKLKHTAVVSNIKIFLGWKVESVQCNHNLWSCPKQK